MSEIDYKQLATEINKQRSGARAVNDAINVVLIGALVFAIYMYRAQLLALVSGALVAAPPVRVAVPASQPVAQPAIAPAVIPQGQPTAAPVLPTMPLPTPVSPEVQSVYSAVLAGPEALTPVPLEACAAGSETFVTSAVRVLNMRGFPIGEVRGRSCVSAEEAHRNASLLAEEAAAADKAAHPENWGTP